LLFKDPASMVPNFGVADSMNDEAAQTLESSSKMSPNHLRIQQRPDIDKGIGLRHIPACQPMTTAQRDVAVRNLLDQLTG
jgi:hypothetical protein